MILMVILRAIGKGDLLSSRLRLAIGTMLAAARLPQIQIPFIGENRLAEAGITHPGDESSEVSSGANRRWTSRLSTKRVKSAWRTFPIQGTHPSHSGLSCLEFLHQGTATISADRGIFLETTWRMNTAV